MVSWGPGAGPVRVYEGLGWTSVGAACEGRGPWSAWKDGTGAAGRSLGGSAGEGLEV